MPSMTALVIADGDDCTRDLGEALRNADFTVHVTDFAAVVAGNVQGLRPDLVLASASLGLKRVGSLRQRIAEPDKEPTIVVFPQDSFTELEVCVRAGFDYVTPPFLPGLLRSRLSSCWERGQLTRAVEEMAVAASLREYERDLSIAHEIQSGFLPEHLPASPGWEVAARFRPARQVAGDFYDCFELVNGSRVGFIVADVCDKGVGAALFMALIRTLLRHTAEHTGVWNAAADEPGLEVRPGAELPPLVSLGAGPLVQAVVGTNRYLARNHLRQGYFATLFFGVLDPETGALVYINGGHNPPVLIRSGGEYSLLAPTGPAVGMMPNSTYSLGYERLDPGDSLLAYTDGVTEARNAGGVLSGMERVLSLAGRPVLSAEEMLNQLEADLRAHVGHAEQSDDITMLALRRQQR